MSMPLPSVVQIEMSLSRPLDDYDLKCIAKMPRKKRRSALKKKPPPGNAEIPKRQSSNRRRVHFDPVLEAEHDFAGDVDEEDRIIIDLYYSAPSPNSSVSSVHSEYDSSREVDGEERISTELCNSPASPGASVNSGHGSTNEEGRNKKYSCPLCSYTSNDDILLKYHFTDIHTPNEPSSELVIIPEENFDPNKPGSSVEQHIEINHKKNKECMKKKYSCPLCSFTSNDESLLKFHFTDIHTPFEPCIEDLSSHETVDPRKTDLRLPIKLKNKKRIYLICYYCKCKTHSKKTLKLHIKTQHTDFKECKKNKYCCPLCSFSSKDDVLLKYHFTDIHTPYENFSDVLSSVGSIDGRDPDRRHPINLKDRKLIDFICYYCKYKTHSKKTLRQHITAKHIENKEYNNNEYSCPLCSFTSKDDILLKCHFTDIHTPFEYFEKVLSSLGIKNSKNNEYKKNKYSCPLCSYTAKDGVLLKYHFTDIHTPYDTFSDVLSSLGSIDDGEHSRRLIDLICYYCECKTHSKKALKMHIATKHMKNIEYKINNKYSCPLCGFKSKNDILLKYHFTEIHTPFEYFSEVLSSLGTKHRKNKEYKKSKYSCPLCTYTSKDDILLKYHFTDIHTPYETFSDVLSSLGSFDGRDPFKLKSSKLIDFVCYYCKCKTHSKKALKLHITKTHMADVEYNLHKYSCPLCSFTSNDDVLLKCHFTDIHTPFEYFEQVLSSMGIKHTKKKEYKKSKYSCPLCSYTSKDSVLLKYHFTDNHTPYETFSDVLSSLGSIDGRESDARYPIKLKEGKLIDFICYYCKCQTHSKRALKLHITTKHMTKKQYNKNKYSCPLCNYTSEVEILLKYHFTEIHTPFEYFSEVLSSFGTKQTKNKETKKNKYSCPLCSYTSKDDILLKYHFTDAHTPYETFSDVLSSLGTFDGRDSDQRHPVKLEDSKLIHFICYYCKCTTHSKKALKQHIKTKHMEYIKLIENKYSCPLCSFTSNDDILLECHFTDIHTPFEYVEQVLSSMGIKHATNNEYKKNKYSCPLCSYTAKDAVLLKYHFTDIHTPYDTFSDVLSSLGSIDGGERRHSVKLKDSKLIDFTCYYCKCNTHSKKALKLHITRTHVADIECNLHKYSCPLCSFTSNDEILLKYHFTEIHTPFEYFSEALSSLGTNQTKNRETKKNKYSCPLCSYTSKDDILLKYHFTDAHTPYETFSDVLSSLGTFDGRDSDQRHPVKLEESKLIHFICYYCKCTTHSKKALKLHIKTKHMENIKLIENKYSCPLCSFTSNDDILLECHFTDIHTPFEYFEQVLSSMGIKHAKNNEYKKNKYSCPLCSYTAKDAVLLKYHFTDIHTPYETFSDVLSSLGSIDSGERRHSIKLKDSKLIDFTCYYCKCNTHSKKALKLHITRTHVADIECNLHKYSCPLCSFTSNDDILLKYHFTEIHTPFEYFSEVLSSLGTKQTKNKETKKNKYSCPLCSYTSKDDILLKYHFTDAHTPYETFSDVLSSLGTFDGRDSGQRHPVELKESKLIHFICYYCKCTTHSKKALKLHIKTKHMEYIKLLKNKYSCPLCSFTSNDDILLECHFTDIHTPFEYFEQVLSSMGIKHAKKNEYKKNKYSCPLCSYTSKDAVLLKYHFADIHTPYETFSDVLSSLGSIDGGERRHSIKLKDSKLIDFTCYYCKCNTHSKKALKLHITRTHVADIECNLHKYSCPLCSFTSNDDILLKYHFTDIHTPFEYFSEALSSLGTKQTKNRETKKNKYSCPLCSYTSKDDILLKYHFTDIHTPYENFSDVLSSLGTFEARKSDRIHPIKLNNNNLIDFISDTHSKKTRKRHMTTQHSKNKDCKRRKVSCTQCDFSTMYEYRLKNHIETSHTNVNPSSEVVLAKKCVDPKKPDPRYAMKESKLKEFRCGYCKYKTEIKGTLKWHIMTKHMKNKEYNKKKFSCPLCGFSTMFNATIKYHFTSIHTSVRPFSCNQCSYAAVNYYKLNLHIKVTHKGEKPYTCSQCNYGTASTVDLRRHVMSQHLKEKPFTCTQCDYSCVHKTNLTQHIMQMHTKKFPYSCTQCSYRAITKSKIKKHQVIHDTSKAFQCSDCNYASKFIHNLNRHTKKKHPK